MAQANAGIRTDGGIKEQAGPLSPPGAEHYFDWAATAPADAGILRQAMEASLMHWGNPSSIHAAGADARRELERWRERAARALGVPPRTVIFTSGGTEGDHIPLLSVLTRPQKGSVVVSGIEHPAVREMAGALACCGWEALAARADSDGVVRPQAVLDALRDDTALVAVMAVNNETGAIQPVAQIADALTAACAGRRRPHFHADCVQAAGKVPLDLAYPGIDSAALSAHKLGGPRGAGVLYLAREAAPFLRGGGQERGMRSGTESIFGAAATALCLEKYAVTEGNAAARERLAAQERYTAGFIARLRAIPGCAIIPRRRGGGAPEGAGGPRYSPWVVQAAFPGIPGQVMERALSAEGFYISTGSACSSGRRARPVLEGLGLSAAEKEAAVRFSFGPATTERAMQELAEAVARTAAAFAR